MFFLLRLYLGLLILVPSLAHAATLENPGQDQTYSGIGVISGWKCAATAITVRIDGGTPIPMLHGSERGDTRRECGDTANGFLAIFNWALLDDGEHTAVAYDNGVEFDRSTFEVGTLGEEFVQGAEAEVRVEDFPSPGESALLVWNQSSQHFEVAPESLGPDLIVQSPSVSDNSPDVGESFTLRATVRNQGDEEAASTTLRYYRSSDSTISSSDTQVGTDTVSSLNASGTSPESISVTAPTSAGTYYYRACVDSVSGEANSGNNCSAGVRVTVQSSGGGGASCYVNQVLRPGDSCTNSVVGTVTNDGGCLTMSAFGTGRICGGNINANGFQATRSGQNYTITALPGGGSGGGGNTGSGGTSDVPAHPTVTLRFSPSSGVTVGDAVQFIVEWNRVPGATNYKVHIDDFPIFFNRSGNQCTVSSEVIRSATTASTSYTYHFTAEFINNYYAFVQACNSSGECSCP